VGKLMPGDQVWAVNGEDVKSAPRDRVIQLVRNCRDVVSLTVCQPPLDNVSSLSKCTSVFAASILPSALTEEI